MVKLEVRQYGRSLGVVLPEEVVERLGTSEGETLFLVEDEDGGYRLTRHDPASEEKLAKAEDIMNRYRESLKVLAEG